MKKIICIVSLICLLITSTAFAEVDISGLSFEELVALQTKVNQALWDSDGWNQVTVPEGVYKIGEDIPAGRWTLKRAKNDYTYMRVGKRFTEGKVSGYTFTSEVEEETNLILEEGSYIEILHNPLVFTPYVASFSFN